MKQDPNYAVLNKLKTARNDVYAFKDLSFERFFSKHLKQSVRLSI